MYIFDVEKYLQGSRKAFVSKKGKTVMSGPDIARENGLSPRTWAKNMKVRESGEVVSIYLNREKTSREQKQRRLLSPAFKDCK